ncbi:MAG: hypothetical protein IPI62_14085 [Bacteroidetes bacterium]|nr:hypothetical protein [Bacteroidota bacterium]
MRALFLFSVRFLKAQTNLPVGATDAEKAFMPSYLQQIQSVGITTPPGGGLRTMAEWEEIKALTITWTSYLPVLREIVRATQIETQVYIVCSDSNVCKKLFDVEQHTIDQFTLRDRTIQYDLDSRLRSKLCL